MNKFFGYFAAGTLAISAIMAFTTVREKEVISISSDNYAIEIPEGMTVW